jgi:hypothetical protein
MSKKYDLAKLLVLVAEVRNEEAVLRQELAERQRKGLSGNAAIAHYNEWMQRYGMEHLMVREVSV